MENSHEVTHTEVRCVHSPGEESQNGQKVVLTSCTGDTVVKNLPARQETWVPSLGREDLLEKGRATHSTVPPGIILKTEEPGRLQSMMLQRDTTERLTPTAI